MFSHSPSFPSPNAGLNVMALQRHILAPGDISLILLIPVQLDHAIFLDCERVR